MKNLLDWKSKLIVGMFDDVSLWAAPFGRLMLENIPMQPKSKVLDIGFGTGFPLIELSQRFDKQSIIYGLDIWEEAVLKTRKKALLFDIQNVRVLEQDAETIPLTDGSIDLVCSNLGINNFSNRSLVINEIYRVLKPSGSLCITTNPIGTFEELEEIFKRVLDEMELPTSGLTQYFTNRGTEETICKEFLTSRFKLVNSKKDSTFMRFLSAESLFDHSFMRIAYRASWEQFIPSSKKKEIFQKASIEIDKVITQKGELKLTIPMLYFHFEKV